MKGPNDISEAGRKRAEIAASKGIFPPLTGLQIAAAEEKRFEHKKSLIMASYPQGRNLKRKHLFNDYVESSSDDSSDEEIEHADKKVKLMKQPLNYCQSILKTYQTKNYEECLKLIDDFLKLPTTHPQYKPEKSCSQFKIIQAACWTMMDMNQKEALQSLNEIIKSEPTNSFAIYGIGFSQYRNGDLTGCMDSFSAAIDLNPTGAMKRAMEFKAKAKFLMDLLCDANHQFELLNCSRAVEMLNAAATVDPENKKIIKIIVEMRDHFVKDLVARLEQDIELDFPDKYSEVEKLILTNQLVKADKLVDEIYNEEPKNGRSCYIKALALYMAGSLKESLKVFKTSIELDGTQQNVKRMETKVQTLQKLVEKAAEEMNTVQYEEAIKTLTEALQVDQKNRVINQAAHFQRALAHFNLGHFESAFFDYKKFESLKKFVGNVLLEIKVEDENKSIEKVEITKNEAENFKDDYDRHEADKVESMVKETLQVKLEDSV